MNRPYLEMVIARGGGLITLGGNLGVMVGPPESACNCPAGWGFADATTVTVEQLAELCASVPKNVEAFRGELVKSRR